MQLAVTWCNPGNFASKMEDLDQNFTTYFSNLLKINLLIKRKLNCQSSHPKLILFSNNDTKTCTPYSLAE